MDREHARDAALVPPAVDLRAHKDYPVRQTVLMMCCKVRLRRVHSSFTSVQTWMTALAQWDEN